MIALYIYPFVAMITISIISYLLYTEEKENHEPSNK